MPRRHVATRKGGIAEVRSKLPEIAAELPLATHAVAMQVAEDTATKATERARAQYDGDDYFKIHAAEVDGTKGEVRGGQMREGKWITGWSLQLGHSGHVLQDKAAGVWAEWYWFFGEFGTNRQPAKPFMIPALEEAYAKVHPNARRAFARLGGGGVK